jgi:hypothetical protein
MRGAPECDNITDDSWSMSLTLARGINYNGNMFIVQATAMQSDICPLKLINDASGEALQIVTSL